MEEVNGDIWGTVIDPLAIDPLVIDPLVIDPMSGIAENLHESGSIISWKYIAAYAVTPTFDNAPCRKQGNTALYDSYRCWLVANDMSNSNYIRRYVAWNDSQVALEPNLAPYNVEEGIEHWTMWFNDASFDAVPASSKDIWVALDSCIPNLPHTDVLFYENHPEHKSIPDIPHVHVFIRRGSNHRIGSALDRMRAAWVKRSPFLQENSQT